MPLFLQQIYFLAKVIISILFCFLMFSGQVQIAGQDSIVTLKSDSARNEKKIDVKKRLALSQLVLKGHPFFNFRDTSGYPPYTKKIQPHGKEIFFYIIMALFLVFAILKASFSKYFSDLLNLFFRRSLKHKQLKQQVVQNSLPSLLFNIFFILTAGFYVTLAIQRTMPKLQLPLWQLIIYTTVGIGAIYIVKFAVLKFIGWVFRISKLTDNYIFILFLINKTLSFLLLPLLPIMSLLDTSLSTIAWTLSLILISVFLLYRYISAIGIIRKGSGINLFHFLLYIAAFEILPTIILYKGIISFLK